MANVKTKPRYARLPGPSVVSAGSASKPNSAVIRRYKANGSEQPSTKIVRTAPGVPYNR